MHLVDVNKDSFVLNFISSIINTVASHSCATISQGTESCDCNLNSTVSWYSY